MLADITDPSAVLRAMAEYDELGGERLCEKYGYGRSRKFWIVHKGKRYVSKAILGAAHGYRFPARGPLRYEDFSGGAPTIEKLEALGFEVIELPRNVRARTSAIATPMAGD